MNEFDKKRLECNRALVKILTEEIEKRPTERFGQLLRNCGFVEDVHFTDHRDDVDYYYWKDEFYEEPWDLLKRVKEN